ncbi:hypothetical protein EYF80_052501 [Liparis tanakae]|uniref:Uncharacterized protein n=1 Tax=Liparis tanakae TaxID=230148 RepID=A0A4Z2F8K4_9TELE|nr:hypothetical protein EYF80_052501 [Liparis tanakae]
METLNHQPIKIEVSVILQWTVPKVFLNVFPRFLKLDVDRPLVDGLGGLQEAGVVGFLQSLIGLRDEGRGPLDALLAVGDLLGELPNPLGLGKGAKYQSENMTIPSSGGSGDVKRRIEVGGWIERTLWEDEAQSAALP